jgi:hypothetical protein
VSFDVFVQAFERGDAASRDGEEVRRLLLARSQGEPRDGFLRLSEAYGDAEVYGLPDEGEPLQGLMFTHFTDAALDTIVVVAQMADLVVVPVGCRVCVVRDAQREHLPDELTNEPIELIQTGEDLAAVIAM